jgi:hypothetical protein
MRRTLVHILFGLALLGCQPKIGDACAVSTDCSIRGDRICDISQPSGYCTVLGCLGHPVNNFESPGACPHGSACIATEPAVPGCGYDDRRSPARSTRTLCLAICYSDGDCRPGYRCATVSDTMTDPGDPTPRFKGRALDDGPIPKVCVPQPYDAGIEPDRPDAAVCSPSAPPVSFDAGMDARVDASSADAGTDAEGGSDAQAD